MKINRGYEAETLTIKAGFTINDTKNAKATEQPDAWDRNGCTHQLKSDKATIANNYKRELGTNILKETEQLLADDYSEYVTLVATWKGTITLYSFTKQAFCQMINEYSEIVGYDRASKKNGGKVTIRIKVKPKYKIAYEKYYTNKLEV